MKRLLSLAVVLAAVFVWTGTANAQENACYDKGGIWDEAVGRCTFQAGVTMNVQYPLWVTDYEFAESAVDSFIMSSQSEIWSFFQLPATLEEMGYFYNWDLSIDYEEFQFSETVRSIVFNVYTYTGGAHPNSHYEAYSFDLENETVISFMDLFREDVDSLAVIQPLVEADLVAQLGEMSDIDWIRTGTEANPVNYRNFALTPDSLLIFFSPYQVAAYAAGPQLVEIPLGSLADILAEPYQPA